MKGDAKVIDYLNAALRSELTAVSQYWLHYRLQEDWGFGRIADKSRAESIEEMHHADRLIARIIFLEGHPNLQKLDSLRIGQTLRETLECDLAAEHDARTLYIEARDALRDGRRLRDQGAVRGADHGRGRPYRLSRDADRPVRLARRGTLRPAERQTRRQAES